MKKKKEDLVPQKKRVLAEIKDIQSYMNLVLDNAKKETCIYRGHASKDWLLKSSIGRSEKYNKELEKDVFLQFKMNYYSYTRERPSSDMDLLFLAQHYGLPTRLLDFTYNPMIALYFACENEPEKDGQIYVKGMGGLFLLDAESNEKMPQSIDELLSIKKAFFIVPNYTDTRYKNQKALFFMSDHPEKEVTIITDSYIVKREYKEQILHDLAILGYDRTLVYPLLDSLCSDIKKRNGLK